MKKSSKIVNVGIIHSYTPHIHVHTGRYAFTCTHCPRIFAVFEQYKSTMDTVYTYNPHIHEHIIHTRKESYQDRHRSVCTYHPAARVQIPSTSTMLFQFLFEL